jgi:hypothetical protein
LIFTILSHNFQRMTISPKKAMEEVILRADNMAEFTRAVEDLFDYKFGTPGQHICNADQSGMKKLPTQDDKDSTGRRIYRTMLEDPTQLIERDYVSFQEDRKRAIKINDKYKQDDIDCVSYLMQHLSPSVTTDLRNSPDYKAYKALPEGDRSYTLFQAIKKIVSTPDVNSMVIRACDYLGTPFSVNINQTMDMINVRSAQFKEDFATDKFPDSVTFDNLKSVVIFGTLSQPAFQTFKQIYSASTHDPLGDSERLMQAALTYASANKQYVNSFPTTDPESERGQAYNALGFIPAADFEQSPYMQSSQVTGFMQTPHGQAYKAEFKKPGGSFFPVQHSAPFSQPSGKFEVVGPPITNELKFCHDCYVRTGKCYTNHGNPGQSTCGRPSLERNPEATAIKSYIAELMINPNSVETVSALHLMDQMVSMCD